jgi:hypothetical protein
MMNAGTPCPFDGMIGDQAKEAWQNNPELQPNGNKGILRMNDNDKSTVVGAGLVGTLLLLLLL